jgi:hypothetical protein
MMEAARTSETSAYFNDTTRRNIPESYHLHTRLCEDLKSHKEEIPRKNFDIETGINLILDNCC